MSAADFLILQGIMGRQISLAKTIESDVNWSLYYAMQELTGPVAPCTNVALTTGRDIALKTYADYTPGANWSNPSGEIARHAASSAATLALNGVLAAGKTFTAKVTIANRTAGSVTITDGGAAFSANTQTTRTITSTGANFVITPTTNFDGDIDVSLIEIEQTSIAASSAFPGAELWVDGDMEAVGVGAWTSVDTISKEAGTRTGGVGLQVLRVTRLVNNNPNTRQAILTVGQRYKSINWARSDGNAVPRFLAVALFWTGTNSAAWQNSDFEFVATSTAARLQSFTSTGTEYTEWDDVSLKEANPLNGDHTGVTLGQSGNAQVPYMVEYGGVADYTNVDSAGYNSKLDPTEFALSILVQKPTWDAVERYFVSHTVDANNWIRMGETGTTGQLVWEVRAGGTTEQILLASGSPTDVFQMGIQVKSGVMSAIYRGEIIDTENVAGTFVGNFDTMIIGAKNDTPNNVHLGKLAYHTHTSDEKSASQWLREARAAGAT